MKIVLTEGFYSTNIGNSFFMKGAKYIWEKVFPDDEIFISGDVNENHWNSNRCKINNFQYLEYLDVDFIVITGPMLAKNIYNLYGALFKKLLSNNIKIILFSAGGYKYDKSEISICTEFLTRYKPFLLITRDDIAFKAYNGLADISLRGICSAWYINDYFKEIPITAQPFITLAFDEFTEPMVNITNSIKNNVSEDTVKIKFPRSNASSLTRKLKRCTEYIKLSTYPEFINDYQIIRPVHGIFPSKERDLFRRSNTYVSEVPEGYLNLYKQTSLNLTDRVHSAVASLSFGKPTRLFTESKRANLFKPVGMESVLSRITYIDNDKLLLEKSKLENSLHSAF